ncbi:MAG: FAD binding domain-containing protein [Ardenticatenaceae bacterium]|nr:FAD binding domain-containing protein [Ardenticatenaceae bacterium]MCB9445449.1 FAD binding domain-containing protein [Ardenticatenaceae bacterium]
MPKRPTHYYRPENLDDALRLLAQPDTLPLAGGTKLLTGDVESAVVDLQAVGLNQIAWVDGVLHVGATATLTNLAAVLAEKEDGPANLLQPAIHYAGPNTYRNAATLGGTVASRLPDSELLAALLVLDTVIHLANGKEISLGDYLAAAERPSTLITSITIPWNAGQGRSERVARTPADYPIVSVTLWRPAEGSARLAATGLGERPFRLTEAEAHLDDIESAAAAAKAANQHTGDFRGDAAYRAEMAAVLTRRVLEG